MSYVKLHEINNRANPENFCIYKHSILLHSLYNTHKPQSEWLSLIFNQKFNSREKTFKTFNNSKYKIGRNKKLSNRLVNLNNKIELYWLNKEKNAYKLLCKQKLL